MSERGRHLGRYLLDGALRWMANDAARHNREPYVLTQIDPANHASMHLFSDLGFIDEGVDEDDLHGDVELVGHEPRIPLVHGLGARVHLLVDEEADGDDGAEDGEHPGHAGDPRGRSEPNGRPEISHLSHASCRA
nr:N-acetyltransferase [Bifidobacterium callitrichos]